MTGLGGFSTAAGYIGPNVRIDHDISLLVPEIWCRLTPQERDPGFLIAGGYLEKMDDFEHGGRLIPASRLGYRITTNFVRTFFGRVFDNPSKVFDEAILKPETQDYEQYVDGILNITEAHQRVAAEYLKDGSIADACPPLEALLTIMANGDFRGMDARHPEIRKMFTREALLSSDWYRKRLKKKQIGDVALWKRHVSALENFMSNPRNHDECEKLRLTERRDLAARELQRAAQPQYLEDLVGTLGTDLLGAH